MCFYYWTEATLPIPYFFESYQPVANHTSGPLWSALGQGPGGAKTANLASVFDPRSHFHVEMK